MFRLSAIGGGGVGFGWVSLDDEVGATVLVVRVIIPQTMLTCTGNSAGRNVCGAFRCTEDLAGARSAYRGSGLYVYVFGR